jgi:hypothetical protein
MTTAQIFARFRGLDDHGRVKPPPLPGPPSYRQMHAHHCFLAGVWDRATVARLWRVEQARHAAAGGDG